MTGAHTPKPLPPMPETSVTAEDLAKVTTDDVIAHAAVLRLYATLAPERRVQALLMADTAALAMAIAEVRDQAYNDGFRAGQAHQDELHAVAADNANRKAVGLIERHDEVQAARSLP